MQYLSDVMYFYVAMNNQIVFISLTINSKSSIVSRIPVIKAINNLI